MQVIGHRGAAALAPENTWAGFDRALEVGVDAIETDVRATSDGQLVLIHDARLDRTTDGQGLVQDAPWSVVQSLDAGTWFDPRFAGARVPRLDETLKRYGSRVPLVLEIKQPGVELSALEMVDRLGLLAQVAFTSFDFAAVHRIKAHWPATKVGFLTSDIGLSNVQRVIAAGMDQFCPPADALTPASVAEWRALGLEVRAWKVRDLNLMERAILAGVDGMTVDFPHLLLKALGRA